MNNTPGNDANRDWSSIARKWALPACLFICAICAICWLFGSPPPKDSGAYASWAQAIFSVIAIGAAIAISSMQHGADIERAKALEFRRASDQIGMLISLWEHAARLIMGLPGVGAQQGAAIAQLEAVRTDEFERTIKAIEKIGPEHVPHGEALVLSIEMHRRLSDALRWIIPALNSLTSPTPAVWDQTAEFIEDVKRETTSIGAVLRAMQNDYR